MFGMPMFPRSVRVGRGFVVLGCWVRVCRLVRPGWAVRGCGPGPVGAGVGRGGSRQGDGSAVVDASGGDADQFGAQAWAVAAAVVVDAGDCLQQY